MMINFKPVSTTPLAQLGATVQRATLFVSVILLTLAPLLIILAPTPAYAATTITVDTTDDELNADGDCSLREAIEAANTKTTVDNCVHDGSGGIDTIILPSGTYDLSLVGADEDSNATGDLDILAPGVVISGTTTSIIDGQLSDRVLDVQSNATVMLYNLTVQNGALTDGNGGGIRNDNGSLTLDNAAVINNSVEDQTGSGQGHGGGIYNTGLSPVISLTNTSLISGNQAINNNNGGIPDVGGRGGGIYNPLRGTVIVDNSTIAYNQVQVNDVIFGSFEQFLGGGIYNEAGIVILRNGSVLAHNEVVDNASSQEKLFAGGGLYSNSTATVSISDTDVMGNAVYNVSNNTFSQFLGGGVYAAGEPQIINSRFYENESANRSAGAGNLGGYRGGAIYIGVTGGGSGGLVMSNSLVYSNTARDNGGGLYLEFSQNTIEASQIYSNSAALNGGGLYNDATIETKLIDSWIHNNAVTTSNDAGGGGLYSQGSTVLLTRTHVLSNVSAHHGGGILSLSPPATVSLYDSRVQNNRSTAGNGGGIYNTATLNLYNSTVFSNNTTVISSTGGGIYNSNGPAHIAHSTIEQNQAEFGGGIYQDASGQLELMHSTVSHNMAVNSTSAVSTAWGGGLYLGGLSYITHSHILSNSTDDNGANFSGYGGGIYAEAQYRLVDSTVAYNESPSLGGGLLDASASNNLISRTTIAHNQADDGAGLYNRNSSNLNVYNSTFSGNTATNNGGGIHNQGLLNSNNATIAFNQANSGGNLYNDGSGNLKNTLIANPLAGDDCAGPIPPASFDNNLDTDGSCNLAGGNDISNGSPNLGPLQDNGGPTETHALGVGSDALDAGATCPAFDQRGVPRPQGGDCDIGAYEAGATNISVLKQATPDPVLAGEVLTYTIFVSNTSNVPAPNTILTDTLPASVTLLTAMPEQGTCDSNPVCELGVLAANSQVLVTVTVQVDPLARVSVTNVATVTTAETDNTPANNSDTLEVTVEAEADVSVVKTVDDNAVGVGDSLTYTLAISNDGPSTATGLILTDTLPSGVSFDSVDNPACSEAGGTVTCNWSSLPPSLSDTVNIQVTAVQTGSYTNTATSSITETDPVASNDSGSVLVEITNTSTVSSADVSVVKTASDSTASVGDTITYTLLVENEGPDTATGLILTDTLPGGVSFVSVDNPACSENAGVITCTWASLPATLSDSVSIVVTTTDLGLQSNSVEITSNEDDPDLNNNSSSADVTVSPVVVTLEADLSLSKTASADPVAAGDNFTYTLVVENLGPDTASVITLTDNLPADVTFVGVDEPACSETAGTVTCLWASLGANEMLTVNIEVTAPITGMTLFNSASVAATTDDPNLNNNSAFASTTVLGANDTDILVEKVSLPASVTLGETITYLVTVTNQSMTTATNTILTDTLSSGLDLVSFDPGTPTCDEVGSDIVCEFGDMPPGNVMTLSLVVSPTMTGTVSNSARATTTANEPNLGNNEAGASTTVVDAGSTSADLSLSKTASVMTGTLNSNFSYSLTVSNAGPDTAQNITLVDTLPSSVDFVSVTPGAPTCSESSGTITCNWASLNSGASEIVEITVTAMMTDTAINTATVTSDTSDPDSNNNTASASVNLLDGGPSDSGFTIFLPIVLK